MMVNIRISELVSNTGNAIPFAMCIIISLSYYLFIILPCYDVEVSTGISNSFTNVIILGWEYSIFSFIYNLVFLKHTSSNLWDGSLAESSHITSIGSVMYTNYNMWLLIASFILLLAMVGSIVITLKPFKPTAG